MPRLVKEKPVRRKEIDVRIIKDFQIIDRYFQIYCINNNLNEAREIRRLIKEFLEKNNALPRIKRLDEY